MYKCISISKVLSDVFLCVVEVTFLREVFSKSMIEMIKFEPLNRDCLVFDTIVVGAIVPAKQDRSRQA